MLYYKREEKPKPVREEVYPSELIFKNTDFSFIDKIVDPDREKRHGSKGYQAPYSWHYY